MEPSSHGGCRLARGRITLAAPSPSHRSRLVFAVLGAALGSAVLAGCDQTVERVPTLPTPSRSVLTSSLVTGEAARHLNADGQFVLPSPGATQFAIISEADARARAEAWVRDFGQFNRPYLEMYHGAPIDFSKLRVCRRVYFAASPRGDGHV